MDGWYIDFLSDAPLYCGDFAQAPVPLSIFRSNSKFDENSKHSSVQYTRPITTDILHTSTTVSLSWRVQNIVVIDRVYSKLEHSDFHRIFWIRSKICLVGRAPGLSFSELHGSAMDTPSKVWDEITYPFPNFIHTLVQHMLSDTWHNNDIIFTSKRRCDVVLTW